MADHPTGEPADDQPGRPIRPAAVIAPVAAAIDAVGARQPARLIITPVAIIAVGIIIAVAGLVAVPVVTAIAPPVAHVLAAFALRLADILAALMLCLAHFRSEELRGGKEGVSTCSFWCSQVK